MDSESNPILPTLLTFEPMVDSELSRLLLAHYGIAYRERDHLFGWVSLLTLLHGGYGRVPLLYGGGMRLSGPRPIADHFDALSPVAHRLMPADTALAPQVEADWQTYNDGMAADTAVFAYYQLLPARALMTPVFAAPVPAPEAKLTATVYPLLSALLRVLLRLGPQRADEALARIRTTFENTDARVADGRPFLCGDRLTLGDLALASASAPLLLPRGYGAKMPALEEMPRPLRRALEELREHPTAAFVQHLYAEGFASARITTSNATR
jgi:glutathione S-transferase